MKIIFEERIKATDYLKSIGLIKEGNNQFSIAGDFPTVDLAELMAGFSIAQRVEKEKKVSLIETSKVLRLPIGEEGLTTDGNFLYSHDTEIARVSIFKIDYYPESGTARIRIYYSYYVGGEGMITNEISISLEDLKTLEANRA